MNGVNARSALKISPTTVSRLSSAQTGTPGGSRGSWLCISLDCVRDVSAHGRISHHVALKLETQFFSISVSNANGSVY